MKGPKVDAYRVQSLLKIRIGEIRIVSNGQMEHT